tara:strand:+ start:716 stop:1081 length:366 start_codon:yes stop_codon:yes gene_type:complete
MTMHLMPVYYNNINSKKRKRRNKTQSQIKSEAQHNKWLRKMGVHPDQLKEKEKSNVTSIPNYTEFSSSIKTSDRICGQAVRKEQQQYTGSYVLGIATMHKSNLVPVGRGENPQDYAKMRRS